MCRPFLILGLLILFSVGTMIGGLVQLALIRRLEESSEVFHWADDKEERLLRLGWVKPEIISWSPQIILFHNFLSTVECDFFKAIAGSRLKTSTVVDTRTGKGIYSYVQTSSGVLLSSQEREIPIIQAIEKRIAIYSQIPMENGELIQMLRYEEDQFNGSNHDYFSNTTGGWQIANMLVYLDDDVEGVDTYFPMVGERECSCGGKKMKGVCIKPVKGDALLFWGNDENADPKNLQGRCEVLNGENSSATAERMRQLASF